MLGEFAFQIIVGLAARIAHALVLDPLYRALVFIGTGSSGICWDAPMFYWAIRRAALENATKTLAGSEAESRTIKREARMQYQGQCLT